MKCTVKGRKVGLYETECTGEMIEVGEIYYGSPKKLYQCESCKTVKLC